MWESIGMKMDHIQPRNTLKKQKSHIGLIETWYKKTYSNYELDQMEWKNYLQGFQQQYLLKERWDLSEILKEECDNSRRGF